MRRKIVIKIVILVILSIIGYITIKIMGRKEVKVVKVEIGTLESSILYTGVVSPGNITPVYIEAPVLIESITARVGQEVQVGDKLMTFSSKSVIENDKDIKINELDIKDVKLRLADLDGGSLKLELDKRKLEIKNLEEKIKGDERRLPVLLAESKALKGKADAYKKLHVVDGISSTEVNKAITDRDKKNVEIEDLKTTLDLNRQKVELSAVSFESLNRELEIEKSKLKSNLEKLELNNEIFKRREIQLKKPLQASIDGVITEIDVVEGSNMLSGQRLLSISPKGENIVLVEVPMYQGTTIQTDQKAKIKILTYEGDFIYEGIVSRVSNLAKESNILGKKDKVVEIEIKVLEENSLKPGYFVDVEILTENVKNIATVPTFSVIEEGEKFFVYVVKDGKIKKIEIKIGIKTSSEYEVLNLEFGTEVVINPFKVKDGERVRVIQ